MKQQLSLPAITKSPSISIVIEWDNPVFSDLSRAHTMLARLGAQLSALPRPVTPPPELVLVCNPETAEPGWVENEARQHLGTAVNMVTLEVIAGKGLRYYEMKNIGARHTSGDVIIFIDSDVIPEDAWLESLVSAICRENVAVVGGETYVETHTFFQRAFALLWPFPHRTDEITFTSTNRFFANNVAFRKEVFLKHPFPDLPCYRMQSYILGQILLAEGYKIYLYTAARTEHPAINGFKHFIVRALCVGHDRLFYARYQSGSLSGNKKRTFVNLCHKVIEKLEHIWMRKDKAGTILEIALAYTIAIAYYGIAILGMLITYINAEWFQRHFINITHEPS